MPTRTSNHIDFPFLITVILLTGTGFLIFSSAALGLLARDGATFSSVAANQALFGIIGGSIALWVISRLDYRFINKYSLYFFIAAIILTCLTFVPGIGLTLKGATRWIEIAGYTFQPAEILKGATVVFLASYFATHYKQAGEFRRGFLPLVVILGIAAVPMALQPDNDGIMVLSAAAVAIFFSAGGKVRHLLILAGIGILGAVIAILMQPYLLSRITTFMNPDADPQGAGFQVQQSLIAIGSGGVFGKGFGQSIQKFSYLPEPIGDSVFAVAAEEFGFVGSVFLVMLFLAFLGTGLRIAARAQDRFGGLVVVGLVVLIATQAFVNIASLLGLFPLSGLPLTFISHGGTALFIALAEVGIILSISRKMKSDA